MKGPYRSRKMMSITKDFYSVTCSAVDKALKYMNAAMNK